MAMLNSIARPRDGRRYACKSRVVVADALEVCDEKRSVLEEGGRLRGERPRERILFAAVRPRRRRERKEGPLRELPDLPQTPGRLGRHRCPVLSSSGWRVTHRAISNTREWVPLTPKLSELPSGDGEGARPNRWPRGDRGSSLGASYSRFCRAVGRGPN